MERKYYLRGLGIGIAVTAIIMGMIVPRNKKMTDEEIIARAKELGMVENTVLSDLEDEKSDEDMGGQDAAGQLEDVRTSDQDGTDRDVQPIAGDEDTVKDGNDSEASDNAESEKADIAAENEEDGGSEADEQASAQGADAEDVGAGEGDPQVRDARPDNPKDAITSAAIKTITVNGGDGSYTVARKLADVGVVTSAESFDDFLCQNGYDKRLRTGTYSIPADASDEQIARIVTGAE